MPKPLPLEQGASNYKAALAQMTPEMREAFIEGCLASGITEEDVIHALILCQAKVLDAFKSSLTKDLTAVTQGQLGAVAQSVERIRQERAQTDAQQTRLFADQLDKIHQREAKVTERESQSCQSLALNYGAIALASLLLGGWLVYFFDTKRVSDAEAHSEERVKALVRQLPDATRFQIALENRGGGMELQSGSAINGKTSVPRLVIHHGKDTIKNAYRDQQTGDAVVVYQ